MTLVTTPRRTLAGGEIRDRQRGTLNLSGKQLRVLCELLDACMEVMESSDPRWNIAFEIGFKVEHALDPESREK